MSSELASEQRSTSAPTDASGSDGDATAAYGPSDGSTDRLLLDVVFDILSSERRRRVLWYLHEEPETSLGTLAEHIAAIENDKPEQALTSSERKRVYIGLYQCHLPKMDDAGVIDFDSNRGTVERAANADQLFRYLAKDEGETFALDRPRYVFALAVIGAGVLATQQALYPAAWLTGLIIGSLLAMVTTSVIGAGAPSGLFAIVDRSIRVTDTDRWKS